MTNTKPERDVLAGFRPLKDGCIHLRCYVCGRKQSNGPRMPGDPPTAVLFELPCDKHHTGIDPPMSYFDADGKEVCYVD